MGYGRRATDDPGKIYVRRERILHDPRAID
jgi:hypothetical protein